MEALLYVPADNASRATALALTGLRWLTAAFFVMVAVKNLSGDATMASEFQRWGYPDWFRLVTAAVQITGALLLVNSRVAFFGAAVLGCVMVGAVLTHVFHDPPVALISPAVFLVLVGILLVGYRPPMLR